MELDGVTISSNILNVMKYFIDDDSILSIELINFSMQNVFESNSKAKLSVFEVVINNN